jgi:hypothetical protein
MLRHRSIAGTPVRGSTATWAVITDLIIDTLATASKLSPSDAQQALAAAAGAGRMLVAGGHLDEHPLTLVAGDLRCEITTVSGIGAFAVEENLNPIPGAASADSFTIHLPAPAPLTAVVSDAAAQHPRLSNTSPTAQTASTAAGAAALIDVDALRNAARSS